MTLITETRPKLDTAQARGWNFTSFMVLSWSFPDSQISTAFCQGLGQQACKDSVKQVCLNKVFWNSAHLFMKSAALQRMLLRTPQQSSGAVNPLRRWANWRAESCNWWKLWIIWGVQEAVFTSRSNSVWQVQRAFPDTYRSHWWCTIAYLLRSGFCSGWAWLVKDGGKVSIAKSPNAENPLAAGQTPLLTMDVWGMSPSTAALTCLHHSSRNSFWRQC